VKRTVEVTENSAERGQPLFLCRCGFRPGRWPLHRWVTIGFAPLNEVGREIRARGQRFYDGAVEMNLRRELAELYGEMGDGGVRRRRIVAVAKTARTSRRSDTPWRRLLPLSPSARSIRLMIH
jgi:hypothetical protein